MYKTMKKILEKDIDNVKEVSILDLPNEILLQIFSHLDMVTIASKVQLVNKRWYELSEDAPLWKEISFKGNKSICQIPRVVKKYSFLRSLKIQKGLLNSSTFSSAASLQFLNSLTLIECTFFLGSKTSFESLMKVSSLTCLTIEKCFVDNQIYNIISEAKNLKELSITEIESQYLIKLLDNCEIEKLTINKTNHLSEGAVEYIFKAGSENLNEINLSGEKRFSDSAFVFLDDCLNISKLSLSRCDDLTDNTLKKISQLPVLEHLCIMYGSSFTIIGLKELFCGINIHNLIHLDLTRCCNFDDDCLYIVCNNCQDLKMLCLKYCIKLTDNSVFHVIENCLKLNKLDLSWIFQLKGLFLSLVKDHKHLKVLDLRACKGIEKQLIKMLEITKPSLQVYK